MSVVPDAKKHTKMARVKAQLQGTLHPNEMLYRSLNPVIDYPFKERARERRED